MSTELLTRGSRLLAAAAVCAAFSLASMTSAAQAQAPATGPAQAPAPTTAADKAKADAAKAAKARRNAERFEAQARVLTVFDRQGKVMTTIGERAIYLDPIFSPDRTRLAVWKSDLERETVDLWVLDVATAKPTRITANQTEEQEFVRWPVWSPDGRELAYVGLRAGHFGIYRKASNGAGAEQLLYQHPGGGLILRDWSRDGWFLTFSATDLSGGTLYALPVAGDGPRTPLEVFRSTSQILGSHLSPDGRFLAYQSDESGKNEVYVRPFDPTQAAGTPPATGPWQASDRGGNGPLGWRQDGAELYYVAPDLSVMAVEVDSRPALQLRQPKVLFRLSEAIAVNLAVASVSRDGERVVIAVPHAPTLRQITVLDRQGRVLNKVGEPGRYQNPALSPDGTRVAVVRADPGTGNEDIWTFDVASGKGTPVTNDASPENTPIWSPDGTQVAYVSIRRSFSSIYRKAWDGTGNDEQLFQYTPGAFMELADWSADGKFLSFHDGCHGLLLVVPLSGDQKALERKEIEWLRDEYEVAQPRLSPDSRFMAYLSNEVEAEISEVYVRPFDARKPEAGAGGATPVRVSNAGALGMIFWRQDGKELYYLTLDWEVMALQVTTTPTFQAGTARLLFKLPVPVLGPSAAHWKNVSRDGQRFVFTVSVPVAATSR
ncbi:MAG: hypothetical protein ACT4QD_06075 [Acidobacteriota bacterium]